jgi:Straboviridae HNH endonuclease
MKYCTYLTTYSGNKMPPFYIGYSTVKKVQKGYHGTVVSKSYKYLWEKEQQENPNFFKTRIISTHNNKQEANDKERYLQISMNVIRNPLYINQCIFKHFDMTGKKHTKETKKKMSITRKGRIKSKEWCEKISKTLMGHTNNTHLKGIPRTKETKIKIGNANRGRSINRGRISPMFGKKHSEETKLKMIKAWKVRKNKLNGS